MKIPLKLLAVLALLGIFAGTTQAETFFIKQSSSGSATGADCTNAQSAAWFNTSGNWGAGAGKISAGDTVNICADTITSQLTIQGDGSSGSPVILDGTPATVNNGVSIGAHSWITVQNITFSFGVSASLNGIVDMTGASNIVVDSVHIDGYRTENAIWLGEGTNNVTVRKSYIKSPCDSPGHQVDGLSSASSSFITVELNYFENCVGDTGAGDSGEHDDSLQTFKGGCGGCTGIHDWTARWNEFVLSAIHSGNRSWNVWEDMGGNNFVYGNLYVEYNGDGIGGTGVYYTSVGVTGHWFIYGNTYVVKSTNFVEAVKLDNATDYTYKNNIIYYNGSSDVIKLVGTITRTNNLYYAPGGGTLPSCGGTEICGSNPLFTNYGSNDFSLQSGSPAHSTGVNLGAPYSTYIAAGATWPNPTTGTRSGAWDMGMSQIAAGGSPAVSLAPTSLAFGLVTVNTTAPTQTVSLTNTGTATLNISSISLTGTNPSFFGLSTTCGSTLAASASCTLSAIFSPLTAVSYSATISVSDDASGSPHTVPLTGTGVAVQPTGTPGPSILTVSLPSATVGAPYSTQLSGSCWTFSGGILTQSPCLWDYSPKASWLAMTPAGTMSGTPTTAATSLLTVTAMDSIGQTVSRSYSLLVNPSTVTLFTTPPTCSLQLNGRQLTCKTDISKIPHGASVSNTVTSGGQYSSTTVTKP